ncbi:Acyl-CoA dehydrogenase [Sphingobium faniae]|nr:Acyl-CoA dehydrogenase [Sphingobium faniae]
MHDGDANSEEQMVVDALRAMLAEHWRADRPDNLAAVWSEFSAQGFAELGDGTLGLAVCASRELGRAACPLPFIPAVVANILRARLGLGDAVLPMGAYAIAFGVWDGDRGAGKATCANGKVNGQFHFVEDMEIAGTVIALTDDGLCVVKQGEAMERVLTPGLAVPPLSDVRMNGAPATVIPVDPAILEDIARIARLLLVARAEGACRRAFELVKDHVQQRVQFGQALARFQAMQHKLADCFLALQTTDLLVREATKSCDQGLASASFQTDAAIVCAAMHLRRASFEVQHAFGAIGYAEEHEAPRLFRRVQSDLARMGGQRRAAAALGAHMLDRGGAAFPDRDLGANATALRVEIRRWLAANWTEENRAEERARPFQLRGRHQAFSRRLGGDGWLSLAWPPEAGGRGGSPLEQLTLVEELTLSGAPISGIVASAWLLAPEIIRHGSSWLQDQLLPGIRKGELSFALGYSEPEAGSDLTNLRTRAVRDGDDYLITGQKLWGTGTEFATHIVLAARTDPDARGSRGISVFIVPVDLPGITIVPGYAMYGHTFCTQFYDEVRVPAHYMLGAEDGGWAVLTGALAAERVQMGGSIIKVQRTFERLCDQVASDEALARDSEVRSMLGQFAAEIEAARQLSLHSVRMLEAGRVPLVEGAMTKLFSGDLTERFARAAIDILGTSGTFGEEAPDAPLDGLIEWTLRQSVMMVIGGGAAEVQKSIVAQRGLDLPR